MPQRPLLYDIKKIKKKFYNLVYHPKIFYKNNFCSNIDSQTYLWSRLDLSGDITVSLMTEEVSRKLTCVSASDGWSVGESGRLDSASGWSGYSLTASYTTTIGHNWSPTYLLVMLSLSD